MSSVTSSTAYTRQGAAFFVNIAAVTTVASAGDLFAYNETVSPVTMTATAFAAAGSSPAAAGTVLVKDMGKTVTVAGDVYRKVQLANLTSADAAADTFYIKLYDNVGNVCKFASVTRPY